MSVSPRLIRTRIRSIGNTRKITKAMEMDKSNELQKQLQEQKSQIDKLQMVFLKTIASMNAQEAKNKIQPEIIKEFLAVDN